ncbi:MAG TPA: hypothetical protein VGN54_13515 [Mycobacteriales bacterium]|jgi:hypothetical protein|nr:hypothetical protein [Mycobacteriales bacterium]
MWAQLMTMRLQPGKDAELERLSKQLEAIEQPGSGLVRKFVDLSVVAEMVAQ